MKGLSVKGKITAWMTLLMTLLALFIFILLLFAGNAVSLQTSESHLAQTVRSNLSYVHLENGALKLDEEFVFYRDGVHTLLYSKGTKALLANKAPLSFQTVEEPFRNGLIRTVNAGSDTYLVLDLWMPSGWDDGVWVRGIMEAPSFWSAFRSFIWVAFAALLLFIALAAWGSYAIVRRAFAPLDHVIATTAAINEAKDLSGRIRLPEGTDEISRLASTIDKMFERLERSFHAELQFTADVSHELRTPVSIIKGACEYAQKYDETAEEHADSIAMIYRQTMKMSGIIEQLLRMTRLDQGTEAVTLMPLDLGELVNAICMEQNYDASRLHREIEPGVVVNGDAGLLSRLVQNLIENAFKYGKDGGNIWVSVSRRSGECLLGVRDEGQGIEKDEQEKIWQRFYQVDPSRSGSGGAGLGLSLVQQIATIHGGYMSLDSVPKLGSVFTLHLKAIDDLQIEE